ncbi:TPA: hypothetical protein JG812_000113 [Vibrio parahaemolyticus]|uniref:hypothetical protein n=1 Tax=Vibrio alginolyticus TaxID=663 RepID=UPI0018CB175C|nr:hypothetical protein [Vibrio alginolyticus]EGR4214507.1 hypothetical protein [Vibrio cholerae]ELB2243282.1 hypothetical protein [Vibrio parahaemolyticus]EJY5652757.1 hypothetical protein [Vibrio cholerae]MBG8949534.1 hypothetical protein [Vibrio cholerae]MBG8953089.1 hypothetical protein [Vibrio cholerae]
MDNFDALAFPDVTFIDGVEYKTHRSNNKVLVPYTETPDIGIGDVITQKSGKREIRLKVLDTQFLEDVGLDVGTNHPHLLTLKVENMTSKEHQSTPVGVTNYHIGNINGEQLQVGNNNTQLVTINIQNLVEKVAKSNDPEAKTLLRKLLENNTVSSVIGAGTSALLGML